MYDTHLICAWVRTPADSRDCAGSTTTIRVLRGSVLAAARDIDSDGQSAVDRLAAAGRIAAPSLPAGHRVASGHGTTVIYRDGRRRAVRWTD